MARPLKVLMVEDAEDDALLLLRELRKGDFKLAYERVATADSMRTALEKSRWDLIISDYSMPDFSGLEALELFNNSGLDLPFILVSGTIGEEVAVRAMHAGAHDYIIKNNLARLLPAVERELREAEERKERKKAEEALRRREQEFKALVENSSDPITRLDKDLCRLYVNPVVEKLTGLSAEQLIGKPIRPIHQQLGTPEIGLGAWEKAALKVFETGQPESFEFTFMIKGVPRHDHTTVVPEFAKDGTVESVLVISRDISQLKKAEEELRKANDSLEKRVAERTAELDKAIRQLQEEAMERERLSAEILKALEKEKEYSELKSHFVTRTSHEFRTPLSIILSSAELLQHYTERMTEEKKQEHLQLIQEAVTKMTRLLDELLSFEGDKADAGKSGVIRND